MREAVKLAVEEPEIIGSITKKLYPTIAERFETSSSKERMVHTHKVGGSSPPGLFHVSVVIVQQFLVHFQFVHYPK